MKKELKKFRLPYPSQLRLSLVFLIVLGCQGPSYTPKPRAFPKVEYPDRGYKTFQDDDCGFTFEMPEYTTIEKDTLFFNEEPAHPCWFNLHFPDFNCDVHFSYYPISNEAPFEKLNADAFKLAMEHNRKATYIDEHQVANEFGVAGFIFDLQGPVATPFQFFLSDSTNHFFRGALYFNTQVRPDSLAPVYDFVKQDLAHLINTFRWKE
jgi:gliding motility-associated lipoprotein GldD